MSVIQDTSVRARIDSDTKERAVKALAAMGLSLSDAIRLLLFKVADEQRLPFELRVPSKETLEAMAEIESGGGHTVDTVEELMAALDAED